MKKKRILVVEDFEQTRVFVQKSLERKGFDVVLAKNGMEALAFLQTNAFDLVITDYEMPSMNGIQFISEMRENSFFSQTPVILLSANYGIIQKKTQDLGINCFLPKPFDIGTFYKMVDRSLHFS